MSEYAARLSVKRRCAAVHSRLPERPNFAKKWSDSEVPAGDRDFMVCIDTVLGTISINAVLGEKWGVIRLRPHARYGKT